MSDRTRKCAEDCESNNLGDHMMTDGECNCHNAELTTLRERVRELEAAYKQIEDGWDQRVKAYMAQTKTYSDRIRELEQAMPYPSRLRELLALMADDVQLYQGQNNVGKLLRDLANII